MPQASKDAKDPKMARGSQLNFIARQAYVLTMTARFGVAHSGSVIAFLVRLRVGVT